MSGEFAPQAALEVLDVANRKFQFPGLILWLANISAKAVEEP